MTEHTKEPWKHTPGTYVTDGDGIAVCRVDFGCRIGTEATANMRRIVECVNAMAGIDNPQEWVDNARFYSHETVSAIVRERDELTDIAEMLYKECLAERDCFYEYCSTQDGEVPDADDRQSLAEIDAKLDRARAVIYRYRPKYEIFPGTLDALRDLGKQREAPTSPDNLKGDV